MTDSEVEALKAYRERHGLKGRDQWDISQVR